MAEVRTFEAHDKLAQAAAEAVLAAARDSVEHRGRFVWGLAGGNTPAMLYRLLTQEQYTARMPWEQTFVFWGDERWVASNEPESNQRMAMEEMLAKVAIPAANVRPILTTGVTPDEAAATAERHVRSLFDGPPRPDLVLLGMGEDGHTASLFPGSPTLLETEALFAASFIDELSAWRVTATLALLNASRSVLFLVTGGGKAVAAKRVLYPQPESVALPASLVSPTSGTLTWLMDKDAAALLPHTTL
ncbi:MAG: 6-phosphogluconolactonase [Dehalococcoidia bacterium]